MPDDQRPKSLPPRSAAAATPHEAIPDISPVNVASGIAWAVAATLLFVCMTGIVRHVGAQLPAAETAFLRYAFGLVLIVPFMSSLLRRRPTRRVMGFFALRGMMHGGGVLLWFYAIALIPIAEVTALGYVAPLFVTIGAAVFLGEKMHMRRISAIFAGLLGAVVILRPGFQEIGWGQIAQLCAAPLFAASHLLAKSLTRGEDPTVIVGMLTFFVTLALAPVAFFVWQTPTGEELAWLALTAVFATAGHYAQTRSLQAAPIMVTQPVTFLQLVWATLMGVLVFGDGLDPFVILGGAIVVGSATFISYREQVAARKQITPPAGATKG